MKYFILKNTSLRKLLTAIFLLISGLSSGQSSFYKTFGYSADDEIIDGINVGDTAFLMVGSTNSIGQGGYDGWAVLMDTTGSIIWEKSFGGALEDRFSSVYEDHDGNFILIGHTYSYGSGAADGYIVKIDKNGVVLLSKAIGGGGTDYFNNIIYTYNNRYFIAGNTYNGSFGANDHWLLCFDKNFNYLWSNKYGTTTGETGAQIIELKDTTYLLTGVTNNGPDPWNANVFYLDSLGVSSFYKYNTVGFGVNAIKKISNGVVEFVGGTNDGASKVAGVYDAATNSFSNVRTLGGGNFTCLDSLNGNGIVAAGYQLNSDYDVTIVEFDNNYDTLWSRFISNPGNEWPRRIFKINGSYFIICHSEDPNSLGTYNGSLIKFNLGENNCGELSNSFTINTYTPTSGNSGSSGVSSGTVNNIILGETLGYAGLTNYCNTPSQPCLVAQYDFSGDANDASGWGNHGTVNGATLTTDRYGNPNSAYSFDGVNDYVGIPSAESLSNFGNTISISSWINVNQYSSNRFPIMEKSSASNADFSLIQHGNGFNSDEFNFQSIQSNVAVFNAAISNSISTNEWLNYIVSYNGSNVVVYLNGSEILNYPNTSDLFSSSDSLFIGKAPFGPIEFANGLIDDIKIFNCALSAAQIDSLWKAECVPFTTTVDTTICFGVSYLAGGAMQTLAGTYYDTLTAVNGCDSIVTTNLTVLDELVMSNVVTNVSCNGGADGSIVSSATGGSGTGYDWIWSDGNTGSVVGLLGPQYCGGTVTDSYGCTDSELLTITEPAAITGVDNATICQGDSILIGGVYAKTDGFYPKTETAANGCDSSVVVTVFVSSASQAVSGTVFYSYSPISSGEVRLIRKDGNSPQSMFDIDSIMVNGSGEFLFDSLTAGNYLIKAKGDTTLYNNVATYADSTNHWQNGKIFTVAAGCLDTLYSSDVYLIDFPATIGFGTIRGRVINGSPANKAAGDPIPGVDISLEQIPGGIIVGSSTTDNDGVFKISNVPTGNYGLNVDLPGYEMDTITFFDFTSNPTIKYSVEICATTSPDTIVYCSMGIIGMNEIGEKNSRIYPNPADENIFIEPSFEGIYSVRIFDINGKLVIEQKREKGKSNINTSALSKGSYSIVIKSENNSETHQLIIVK